MLHWIWEQPGWPAFQWEEAAVGAALQAARLVQGRIEGMASLLDPTLTGIALGDILFEESVHTAAIEGEALDGPMVRSSIARHLGLPTVGLPAVSSRSIDGLVQVLLDATQQFMQPLTKARLFGWQAALFPTGYSGLHPIRVGKWRGEKPMQVVSGKVGYETVHFLAPPYERLEKEMYDFLEWFNAPSHIDGLVRAGITHFWFVTIHPFEDGNGRLARALTDMAIAQDERNSMRLFSLSTQIIKNRNDYYEKLEQAQRGDLDLTHWLIWFLKQVECAAIQSEQIIAKTIGKARFWLHFQTVDFTGRQRKVLNRLLDAGPNGFEGGINNRKYMALTKTSRVTAYRELSDLVQKGCLISGEGGGRSASYDIPWDKFIIRK